MLDVTLRKGHELVLDVPVDHNALAVVTSGEVAAGGERGKGGELVLFENDGGQLALRAEADAHVVILAGQPIDEPIVQYGPFVMNTEAEIDEAITDFNAGRFGRVPEDREG
jgi:redox-sensitive bicupin YhaK (pirin superfamily)